MVYGAIAGFCLLIPVKKFGNWGKWTVSAAAVLGSFLAAMAVVNLRTVAMYTQESDSYVAWAEEAGYSFAELLHQRSVYCSCFIIQLHGREKACIREC